MVAWAVTNMGGEIPKQDPRLLADNMASAAWNVDLVSGPLNGIPYPEAVIDLSAAPGADTAERAYRIPSPTEGGQDAWLLLPSRFSSVVRTPVANDGFHRVYWTNPDDGAYVSTFNDILTGNPPFNLGFVSPLTDYRLTTIVTGGDTTVPAVARSYVYTFINVFGEESAPSDPSIISTGASDGDWAVYGLPGIGPEVPIPDAPTGKHYPPIAKIRLYRTITDSTGVATFYQVKDFALTDLAANPSTYAPWHDTVSDTDITSALTLNSAGWVSPPDGLDGLIAMPGGFLVGFVGNTLHFSEPDRPHAWPASYDLSVQYDIVGFGLWNQTLTVLTKGFPSTGTGTSPSAFTLTQVQVPEPCLDRGSIITDLLGVYYASQNGLVQLSYYGMQNQTLQTVDKNTWLRDFGAGTGLLACRHRAQYLALKPNGDAFIIDYSDQRLGVVWTDMMRHATSVWNDTYNGDTLMFANKKVFRWDSPNTPAMPYRWRSKVFNLIEPINLGACQITIDPAVLGAPAVLPTAAEVQPVTVMPAGVNCQFRLFVEGVLTVDMPITAAPQATFRLPSGYKAYEFQFEILSQVPVSKVKLAETMKGLNDV